MITYFFIGFFLLMPLRKLMQNKVIIVSVFLIAYFIIAYIYFPQNFSADFHKIFAWQLLFMLSFFYILKYGRAIGQFLYDSTEIKTLALEELQAGVYINKNYIKQILGSRLKFDEFQSQVESKLEKEEKEKFKKIINKNKDKATDRQLKIITIIKSAIMPFTWPTLYKQIKEMRQAKQKESKDVEKIKEKFTEEEKSMFDIILQRSDEIDQFLKSVKGKLTEEQANHLKTLINQRNKEVIEQGKDPVKHIILHKTFSFAPFMLLGVVITLITKSSIIHLIYQYILHR